jgi:hypothetical protein
MDTAARDSQFLDAGAFLGTDEMLAHGYRRQNAGWIFESIGGREAEVMLPSVRNIAAAGQPV